jgi:PAS domain S-box-containing protein
VVMEANRRAERDFGLGTTMMRGYLFHRLVHADDYQAEVRGAILDARATGHADVGSVRFRARAGTQIVGDLHLQCLADNVTGMLQYACVLIDRTQQLADLEQLHASLARLKAQEHQNERVAQAAHGSAVRVLTLDVNGAIQWASADLLQMFGYSDAELVGRPLADLLRGGDATTASEELGRHVANGAGCRFPTVPAYSKDGTARAVSLDLMPVQDLHGRMLHYVALIGQVH